MFTRHGWATLLAAVAAFSTGRLFGLIELYVFGATLVVVLLGALIIVHGPLPAIQVRRVARPSTVSVGEPARVDLQLANTSSRRVPRLRLWEPVGERGGAPMQLAPLPAGEMVTAAYRVPSTRRGMLRIGPLRAERSDPLGLCVHTQRLAGTGEVLVVPERLPLVFPGLGSRGRLGDHLRLKSWGQSGNEFHSQREYVPGDDLRRINWKSTARTGELIVRETTREGVRHCTVVLDTFEFEYDDPDAFERAVVAAASIVACAAAEGVATRLVAPGLDLRGPDVAHESLRWLATVETGDRLVDLGVNPHVDGLGLVVFVTGHSDAESLVSVHRSIGPDDTLTIITTAVAPAPDTRFGVDGTSLETMQMSWLQLVTGRVAA
ncbi:MAG: DUF58 domain-containing protein [Actinomycetota bacterium]